jgi:nicotinamide-nucleotide amidase
MLTEQFERSAAELRQKLADYLYAEGEETMDSVLAGLFRKCRLTVATAESCTGGLLAKRLTDVPGSSAYFLQGAVTYADAAKIGLLGVQPALIRNKGAVSKEVAIEMARGMRKAAGSDLALAITGIAGPDGGTIDKPVGTVFMALADATGCQVRHFNFPGTREDIRNISTFTAMDWLRRHLLPFS